MSQYLKDKITMSANFVNMKGINESLYNAEFYGRVTAFAQVAKHIGHEVKITKTHDEYNGMYEFQQITFDGEALPIVLEKEAET